MNDEQWNFIFKYYPEYGSGPYDLMVWIHNSAQQHEAMYSSKPVLGGRTVGGGDDGEEEDFDSIMGKKGGKIDKGFGKTKEGNKTEAAKKAKLAEEARLKMIADRKLLVQAPIKTEAELKEEKLLKSFKDKPVALNSPDLCEVDETRQPVSMVFIGHVDAGKSTICGNLMYLMGVVD